MAKCMEDFKRANERWCFVRIGIVDKGMREIDVIRKRFPKVRGLLCYFHVIKWLHKTIPNPKKYGVYEEDVQAQIKHTTTDMTYNHTNHRVKSMFKKLKHYT